MPSRESAETVRRGLPRPVEAILAAGLLLILGPLVLLLALAVALSSPGPAFFRQRRVGRHGRPFVLIKLRTMRPAPVPPHGGAEDPEVDEEDPKVTAAGDRRITPLGRLLRATKLDELPELWHVLVGEMSFVGPRPEVPEHVDPEDPLWRPVLEARPGLTDPVTLRLRSEEALVASVPESERDAFYRHELQPWKLRGYADYLRRRTPWSDLRVILQTAVAIVDPTSQPPPTRDELDPAHSSRGASPSGGP